MSDSHHTTPSDKTNAQDSVTLHELRLSAEHDGKHLLMQPTKMWSVAKASLKGAVSFLLGGMVGGAVAVHQSGVLPDDKNVKYFTKNDRLITLAAAVGTGLLAGALTAWNSLRTDKKVAIAQQAPGVIQKYNATLQTIDEASQKNEKAAHHALEETKILKAENKGLSAQLHSILETGPRAHDDFATQQLPQQQATR